MDCYQMPHDQEQQIRTESTMDICRIDQKNRKDIDAFIIRQWFSLQMVVHGVSINLGTADGCDLIRLSSRKL